jgi:uncharacterized protein
MDARVQASLDALRPRLQALYGSRLVQLVLFGSQARGDAEDGSDIDVLVVLKGPVMPGEEITRTGAILADLSLAHDTVLSCVFVSEERFASENSPLLLNIRREGIAA